MFGARVSHEVKWSSVGQRRHVGADLRDQFERGVGADAVNLRQVDAARQVKQRRPDVEPRSFFFGVWRRPRAAGNGAAGARDGRREGLEVRVDGGVALRDLALAGIEEGDVLLQHEELSGR